MTDGLAGAVPGEPAGEQVQSRFARTLARVQQAGTQQRVDFAVIALKLLAEAYAVEARLAREQARSLQNRHRAAELKAWAAAVERFAGQLPVPRRGGGEGPPLRLAVDAGALPTIRVAGRSVILSHPRRAEQSAFEQAILRDFCSRYSCELPAAERERSPIPLSAGRVRPHWTFSEDRVLCAYRGLRIVFSTRADLSRARSVCPQFLYEVLTLKQEIAWQQRHAVSIDWSQLSLQAIPGGSGHVVRLNRAGDSVLASLPLLSASPQLLREVGRWLRRSAAEGKAGTLELRAADYGWE